MSEWEPPGLRELIARLEYKPNWMIYLGTDNEDDRWLTLHIVSETPDSYNTKRTVRVNHSFLVPMASYNEVNWIAWLFDRIRQVEAHEAGEYFMVDGLRVFAPHHGNGEDPYRTWFVGDYADTSVKAGEEKP
jgi:hypothetical protein